MCVSVCVRTCVCVHLHLGTWMYSCWSLPHFTPQPPPTALTCAEPGPPVNLTYEVLKRGSVRLQWSPPSQPNGIITSYVIFYNMESQVPDTLWKNLTQSGQQTIAQVDNLDIKQYFFKMAACTKAGRGHPSNIVVVYPDCAAAQCGPEPQGQCRGCRSGAGFEGGRLVCSDEIQGC